MPGKDPYVELAYQAIRHYLEQGEPLPLPPGLPEELTARRAGAFVSIKKGGELRGCIGTFQPSESTLAVEIIQNAIRAATQDPRFPPLRPEELSQISLSVDVLSPPEPATPDQLDPKRYGVIVESGWRRGLLLPDLPEVDTVEEQLRIAKLKAGIGPGEPCRIFRFTVERHGPYP